MKISKLPTDTRRHALLVVLAVALCVTSCGDEPECTTSHTHKWAKWEVIPTPKTYFEHTLVQRRHCERCGLAQDISRIPK
jgi:hypothetical protein